MTTQQRKEEAIKKAYGELYESHKDRIDEDGYICFQFMPYAFHNDNFDINNISFDAKSYRPKSLRGIDDNNGWLPVTEEIQNGSYEWYNFNNGDWDLGDLPYDFEKRFTHYKPLELSQPPIF